MATTDNLSSLSKSSLLSNENETVAEKLSREFGLLSAIGTGIANKAENKIEHPIGTTVQLAIAYGVGHGLTLLQKSSGIGRVSAEIAALSLGVAFAKDIAGEAGNLSNAVKDTWTSAERFGQNKKLVSDTVGPFILESAMYGAIGMSAAKRLEPRMELHRKIAADETIQNGIFKVHSLDDSAGTAFAIDSNRYASAFHVVRDRESRAFDLYNNQATSRWRCL
jgi:hypothetical protein